MLGHIDLFRRLESWILRCLIYGVVKSFQVFNVLSRCRKHHLTQLGLHLHLDLALWLTYFCILFLFYGLIWLLLSSLSLLYPIRNTKHFCGSFGFLRTISLVLLENFFLNSVLFISFLFFLDRIFVLHFILLALLLLMLGLMVVLFLVGVLDLNIWVLTWFWAFAIIGTVVLKLS